MRFILNLLISGLTIFLAAWILPDSAVYVESFVWAILVAVVIGFVNATIGSVLRVFTFPLNLLTLGLVSFIITILMILLSDWFMGTKFEVNGFWWATLFAIIVAILDVILGSIFSKNK